MGKLQEDSNARALRSLQSQFDDFRTQNLNNRLTDSRELSGLKRRAARLDRKIRDLERKVARSDRDIIIRLRADLSASDREMTSLWDKVRDLKSKVARSDCENIRLWADLSASDHEMTSLWDEVRDLKLVTSSLMPVQRHKLLESARQKVMDLTGKVWVRRMPQRILHEIYKKLQHELPHYHLSEDALDFLANKNTILQEGNAAAHNARVSDIRTALTTDPHFADAYTKGLLQNLFEFVYEQPLHQHVAN